MNLQALFGQPDAVAPLAIRHRQGLPAGSKEIRAAFEKGIRRLAKQVAGLGVAFIPERYDAFRTHLLVLVGRGKQLVQLVGWEHAWHALAILENQGWRA
jgi:hypothetical protein